SSQGRSASASRRARSSSSRPACCTCTEPPRGNRSATSPLARPGRRTGSRTFRTSGDGTWPDVRAGGYAAPVFSPAVDNLAEHLRIDELLRRVERNGIDEVVLATNPNMTGEATAAYLADRLRGRARVTRLASGLPVGGDLEYADEVTLGRALAGRREME